MGTDTTTYSSSGQYSYSIPADTTLLTVTVRGGNGASGGGDVTGAGGTGAEVVTELDPADIATSTLDVYVAGDGSGATGGYNGGGDAGNPGARGGGGGGASEVREAGAAQGSYLALAGGGGGGGGARNGDTNKAGAGGGGGDPSGYDGDDAGATSGGAGEGETGQAGGNGGSHTEELAKDAGGGGGGAGATGGSGGDAGGTTVSANGDIVVRGAGGGGGGSAVVASASNTTYGTASATEVVIEATVVLDTPQNLTASVPAADQIDLDWDAVSNANSYNIYRAESSGSTLSDYTLLDTTTSTSYSDTGLGEGDTKYYRVTAENSFDESAPSNEASASTPLPAPSGFSVDSTGSRQLSVSWTDNSADEDGFIVETSTDGGSSWTDTATTAADATSATVTGLRDGELYDARVRAFTNDVESSATTADSGQTSLPDVQNLRADASVEDQLTAISDDVLNYGNFEWEYRLYNSGNAFTSAGTTGEADPDIVIGGLQDGERYDVRARTTTEHATGDWVTISPVTLLPAASGVTATAVSQTSVTVAWTDEADNETGYQLVREELIGGSYTGTQVVAEYDYDQVGNSTVGSAVVAPSSDFDLTDTTPRPGVQYRYLVRAVSDHATADSSPVEVTTTGLGVPQREVPADGWYVEIDHENGETLTPSVLEDGAEELPRLNARPEARVPVRRSESWLAPGFEDAAMRVWRDGRRLPVDELADIEIAADRTILVGRGGSALDQDVTAQYTSKPAVDAFVDLVQANTGLTVNADGPDPGGATTLTAVDENTAPGLLGLFSADSPTDPFIDDGNGGMQLAQTCFTREGEDWDNAVGSGMTTGQGDQSGGFAGFITDSGELLEYEFTPQHTIPADDFSCFIRLGNYSSASFESHTISIELASGAEYDMQSMDYTGGDISLFWRDVAQNPIVGTGYDGPDIPAGSTHTIKVTGDASNSNAHLIVDVVAPADGRYSYTLDNDNGGNGGYLDGPELYPEVSRSTTPSGTAYAVVGASATTSWTSTAGQQQLELSNDSGQTYPISASNTTSVSGSFSDAGESVQLRATWSGRGTRSDATPQTGFQTMAVTDVEVTIDGKDIPVIARQRYRGRLADVLQEIAQPHDLIWSVERDQNGDQVIELTRPGLRESDASLPTSTYSVTKQSTRVLQATIEGAGREAEETLTADHGTAVALGNAPIVAGSERVTDQTTGTEYDHGEDYTVDWEAGELTALATGAISDGESVDVAYRYKVSGSYTADTYAGDPSTELTERVPELTSERACETFAFRVVDELSSPQWTASVEVTGDSSLSLVDALSLDALPADTPPLEVWSLTNSPKGVSLQLGSRDDITQTVQDLRSTVGTLSKQT